jgi:hypothetical protein
MADKSNQNFRTPITEIRKKKRGGGGSNGRDGNSMS